MKSRETAKFELSDFIPLLGAITFGRRLETNYDSGLLYMVSGTNILG
jgi:hypothetical protein